MWVESPKGGIKESDTVELHCRDNGNPPSSLIAIRHATVGMQRHLLARVEVCAHALRPTVPQSDRTWDDGVLLLRNVSRRDGGLYQCVSTDTDTFSEVSGNMTLTVNCKAPGQPALRVWNQPPVFDSLLLLRLQTWIPPWWSPKGAPSWSKGAG